MLWTIEFYYNGKLSLDCNPDPWEVHEAIVKHGGRFWNLTVDHADTTFYRIVARGDGYTAQKGNGIQFFSETLIEALCSVCCAMLYEMKIANPLD